MKTCLLIVLLLIAGKSISQDIATRETKLIALHNKLESFVPADYDSISFYAGKFEREFVSSLKKHPQSLAYPFKNLDSNTSVGIHTSRDGNLRIYSWDTWTGGTMHIYKQVIQWRGNGKTFVKSIPLEEGDPGSFCSNIFTVDVNNKPYYLVLTNATFSTKDAMQSISSYTIDNDKLNDTVKLFKTSKESLNTINVAFNFFSVVDRPERPLQLITYDGRDKIVYIPVVTEQGDVTKKNLVYQLSGNYFKYTGIK